MKVMRVAAAGNRERDARKDESGEVDPEVDPADLSLIFNTIIESYDEPIDL
jgi:hypothetical protein